MYCVKTGARVYIDDLCAIAAADVYAVGDNVLVVRWNPHSLHYCSPTEAKALGATHFVWNAPFPSEDWIHNDPMLGVLVTQRRFFEGELCE